MSKRQTIYEAFFTMKLSNLKISIRLGGAFALLVLMLIAISGFGLIQLSSVQSHTDEIVTDWLPSVEAANQISSAASNFRVKEYRHLLFNDAASRSSSEKEMADAAANVAKRSQAYEQLVSDPDERKLYEQYKLQWKDYMAVSDQVAELSKKGQEGEARALLGSRGRELNAVVSATLLALVDVNHQGAMKSSSNASAAYIASRNMVIVATIVTVLTALALAIWLVRSITQPLAAAVAAADRVSAGDLQGRILATSTDETGRLMSALDRMQTSLVKTVGSVRQNADGVATASSQIAQGNNDLSSRTEQQASALQETAASMEELSSTVKQNADNARQANQLAQTASSVAVRGGSAVEGVVNTMRAIQDSSKKITDIISVIDGIAFQTNILALNAAVEAARAGEQGRGFAVVAAEVRSLAQRSASAAKEIASLIGVSVERVTQGTTLVDEAGATMKEVVSSIQRVTDIMGEISAASVQQSAGVSQVGEAITQMDRATQQNAALVEESAAAAESLKIQAQHLVGAVSVFKLDRTLAA